MGIGDGDWALGIGDWAQSPIPNPQSPSPIPNNLYYIKLKFYYNIKNDFHNKTETKKLKIIKLYCYILIRGYTKLIYK